MAPSLSDELRGRTHMPFWLSHTWAVRVCMAPSLSQSLSDRASMGCALNHTLAYRVHMALSLTFTLTGQVDMALSLSLLNSDVYLGLRHPPLQRWLMRNNQQGWTPTAQPR
jgi:hypothetical protein